MTSVQNVNENCYDTHKETSKLCRNKSEDNPGLNPVEIILKDFSEVNKNLNEFIQNKFTFTYLYRLLIKI